MAADQAAKDLAGLKLEDSDSAEETRVDAADQTGHDYVNQKGDDSADQKGDDSVNQKGDDSVNQKGNDSVNQKGNDSVNQKGDDSVNQKGDDSVKQKGNDSVNQKGVDSVDQPGRDSTDQGSVSDRETGGVAVRGAAAPVFSQDAVPVDDSETGPYDQSQNRNTQPTKSDQSTREARGFVKCAEPNCKTCKIALPGATFTDFTGTEYTIDRTFTCISKSVVYAICCKVCRKKYVGRTTDELHTRIDNHISGKTQLVDKHFKEGNCSYKAMALFVIERVPDSDDLKERRKYWKTALNTMVPNGLNER